jgi:hypothetical protein
MRTLDKRLNKLEHRFGIVSNAPTYLLILTDAGRERVPADDAYIKSLDEVGLLPKGGFGVIDLIHTPERSGVKHGSDITIELL